MSDGEECREARRLGSSWRGEGGGGSGGGSLLKKGVGGGGLWDGAVWAET